MFLLTAGGNNRSYSSSEELFSELGQVRTPLLRSSSDLGIRLGPLQGQNYSPTEHTLDKILDSSIDSMENPLGTVREGNVFYESSNNGNCGTPIASTTPPPTHAQPQQQNTTTIPGMNPTSNASQQQFSFYSEREHHHLLQGMSVNNITAKLSNFTASLGSLFGPLGNMASNAVSPEALSGMNATGKGSSPIKLDRDSCTSGSSPVICNESSSSTKQQTNKPRYSDVLSKAPLSCMDNNKQQVMNNTRNNPNSHSHYTSQQNIHNNSRNSHTPPNYNKSKNRNNSNNNNGNGFANNGRYNKNESSSSRVGLDGFDIPSNSVLTGNNKNNLYNSTDSLSEKSFPQYNMGDSPSYQRKGNTKNKNYSNGQGSDSSSCSKHGLTDNNNDKNFSKSSSSDQLNNRNASSSSYQKNNNLKKNSYINNNLNTTGDPVFTSASTPTSATMNNIQNCNNKSRSSLWQNKDDNKDIGNNNNFNNNNSSNYNNSATTNSNSSYNHNNNSTGNNRSGGGNGRGNKNPSNRHNDRPSRDVTSKRGNARHRKDALSSHWETANAARCVVAKWLGMACDAVLWLIVLTVDVAVLSSKLLWDLLIKFWSASRHYSFSMKEHLTFYYKRMKNTFSKHKSDGKKSLGEFYIKNIIFIIHYKVS